MPNFLRGISQAKADTGKVDISEVYHLPDSEKEILCRTLLSEFGVTHVRPQGKELIHGCFLPGNTHVDQDRNPTASLNIEKLVWNCLGSCQAGGSILWLIGMMRDVSGAEARKWLADQTGIGGEQSLASLLEFFDTVYSKDQKHDEPIPRMDPKILDPWMLIHPYMTEIRGIPEETLIKFKVGYGVMRVKIGENTYTQSHRIVIPHFWKGNLVGWQTRRIIDDGTPKYQSSPSLPKDRTIYNFDERASAAVIVESPLSVLSKAHLPYHIEATFGAKVPDKQMRMLSIHRKVILFMDNDEAGYKSTRRLGDYLSNYSQVYVVDNPWNVDAGDLSDQEYARLVDGAVPYSLWEPPKEVMVWDGQIETGAVAG